MSKTQQKKDDFDYNSVVKSFNSICKSLPKVERLTDTRKAKIKKASELISFKFEELFRKVENSDFLSGRNGAWVGCSFDWILKPSNLVKIIEGNYDNRGGKSDVYGVAYDIAEYENTNVYD